MTVAQLKQFIHSSIEKKVADKQVVQHLPQPYLVPQYLNRAAGFQADGPFRSQTPGCMHGRRRDGHQFYRPTCKRDPLVQASKKQEVLHQPAHPGGLTADAGHGPLQIVLRPGGPSLEQFSVGRDRRRRGAQFVGGIGDEPAQPGLGGIALRKGLRDAAEHDVQRARQPSYLGLLVVPRYALVELTGRDGSRRPLDGRQGPQSHAGEPPAQHQSGQDSRSGDRKQQPQQVLQRGVRPSERRAQYQLVPAWKLPCPHSKVWPPGLVRCRGKGRADRPSGPGRGESRYDGGEPRRVLVSLLVSRHRTDDDGPVALAHLGERARSGGEKGLCSRDVTRPAEDPGDVQVVGGQRLVALPVEEGA